MSHLLDTHAFLWLLSPRERGGARVRDVLEASSGDLFVSAVSALEVATKTRLGKLDGDALISQWSKQVRIMGARELLISTEHALAAGGLTWEHRDPFDRLLVAQANLDGLTLVSGDAAILAGPVDSALAWH